MTRKNNDLCEHVKAQILQLIEDARRQNKKKLPSENQLAAQLQVSRSTVRTALIILEDEGKVFRRHGSGTYINLRATEIKTTLYPHTYYSDLIARSGYTPNIEILGVRIIPAGQMAKSLNLKADDKVIEVCKIYRADERMCIYCVDCISCALIPEDMLAVVRRECISIFQLIKKYTDIEISHDTIKLEATDNQSVRALNAFIQPEGSTKPFLLMESINYDSRDLPVLYSKCYIDTDLIKFYMVRGSYLAEKPF